MVRTFIALVAVLTIWSGTAVGKNIEVINARTEPFTLAVFRPGKETFGKLRWRGGLVVSSQHPWFGGFSGLALSRDGRRFVAVSDTGKWLRGSFVTDGDRVTNVKNLTMSRMVLAKARPLAKQWVDAEALAPVTVKGIDGALLVGFERRERVLRYRRGKLHNSRRPRLVRHPKKISNGRSNKELEGLGRFYAGQRKGWLIVTSEQSLDSNGNIKGWMWRKANTVAFSLERLHDFAITDLAVSPDGKTFFTLERSFNLPKPPGFAIRRFKTSEVALGSTVKGDVLFVGRRPIYAGDNMEGLAVHKSATGKLFLTLISDDNFNRTLQNTLVMRFEVVQ